MKNLPSLVLFILTLSVPYFSLAQTYGGYTLYSKSNNTKTYLIGMNNTIYHQWTNSPSTGYSVYLLPNQHILRTAVNPGNSLQGPAMCGMVQEVDWTGIVVWQYVHSSATYCTHHDIHPMPNGNVLMIAYEVKSATASVQAGCASSMVIWPEKIIEVQPTGATTGTIVWEWHVWDHLIQNHDATKDNYGVVANHPELLNINYQTQKDWMHVNGIDYNPQLDQIVFSSHYMNEIYVIDHSTTTAEAAGHTGGNSGKGGDFLYRWGNPQAYGAGTASNKIFNVVHDAHWVAKDLPWENRLVAFNNKGVGGYSSCVDVVAPPYNGYNYLLTPGSAYTPATYTWRHNCLGNAQDQSNSQKFPNGNIMVCIASTGYIYEIDSSQTLLWSYTAGGTVAKAFRYPADYVNGKQVVTATASPYFICEGSSTQLKALTLPDGTLTFSWTSDPPGFTSSLQNPVVFPGVTTTYTVIATGAPGADTSSITVIVNPAPPIPTITQSGDTLFSSASSGNQWYLNGNPITGATGPYFQYTLGGNYQVMVTNQNNCTSESAVLIITPAGIIINGHNQTIRIFPTITTGILYIYNPENEDHNLIVNVLDIYSKTLMKLTNPELVDLSSLENGVYFIVTENNYGRITQKIVLAK
ncbi:MAG: aryl-sulfate sulfotransferase [Bacteroidetes bacterium]|nr:aryl-sulfate sulfotransferase [Bacteroidota bacterium]